MAQIVIAGCGYVGNALARLLLDDGHEVYGIRRDVSKLEQGIRGIAGDLADPKTLGPAPRRVEYAVFAVGADAGTEQAYRRAYLDGLAGFLEWLADEGQRPRRLVMTSSTSVYGQRRGERIDEDSPTHPTQFRGETMLASERLLAASGMSTVVLRLGGIYGPGRTGLVERARAGALRRPAEPQYTNRIHRDDAAGLLRHLLFLEDPEPVYLGVDDESAEAGELYAWLAKTLGLPTPETEEPDQRSEGGGRRSAGSKRCSNRLARESGYRFRYPSYREGYGALIREQAESASGRSR
jgi:nucleoside-diphosphate-sugar epimerase